MKSIIIWGAGRSGKSTLAQMIKKEYGHNWIEIDPLRELYDLLLPCKKIMEGKSDFEQGRMLGPLIARYINELEYSTDSHGEYYVFEGVSIDFDYVLSNINSDKYIILCMGYPNICVEEKLKQLLQYETKLDWTYEYSKSEKLEIIKEKIKESQVIQQTAKRLNIKFIDAAYREQALKNAMDYIKEKLQ